MRQHAEPCSKQDLAVAGEQARDITLKRVVSGTQKWNGRHLIKVVSYTNTYQDVKK